MKKFLLFLLLIPTLAKAQTPITPSYSRVNTQTGIRDSLRITYSSQITPQWWWSSAQIRYWVEHQPHIWYGTNIFNNLVSISPASNHQTELIIDTAFISLASGNTNGSVDGYYGGLYADKNQITVQYVKTNSGIGIPSYLLIDSNKMLILDRINNRGLINYEDYSTEGKKNDLWLAQWGAVKNAIDSANALKQQRIISALPTQTLTRPLVGDSVNQAIQKLTFRGDSLAAAISLKLNKTDTAAMNANLVHKALVETITGAKTTTARFTSQLTTEQLRLAYDVSNYTPFTTSSIGQLAIAPTGGQINITGNLSVSGNLQAGGSNSNIFIPAGQNYVSSAAGQFNYSLGGSANFLRIGYYGSQNTALTANANYSMAVFGNAPVTTAASGTHLILSQVLLKAIGTVTSGGSAITNTSTLTIEGASTAGTNNYSMWVQGGASRFDGNVSLNGSGSTAVTQSVGDNSTKIATDAYADRVKIDNALTKTTNYTILSTDWVAGKTNVLRIFVDATAGNVTITLPTAASFIGYSVFVTKTDASANTVTISPVLTAATLVVQGDSKNFSPSGTTWYNQ